MYQDHNQVIELLAYCYPKAFILNPGMRLPLKPGIENDIDPHEIALAAGRPVDVRGAIAWYRGNTGYLSQIQTGATYYDLKGEPVGTVTLDDEVEAQQKLKDIHLRSKEKKRMNGNGRRNGHMPALLHKPPITMTAEPAPTAQPASIVKSPVATVKPVNGVRFEYDGQMLTVGELIKKSGSSVPYNVVFGRLRTQGWDIETALTTPVQQRRKPRRTRAMEPASPIAKRTVIMDGQLQLATRRIETAANIANGDSECAVAVLRAAVAAIQQTIEAWTAESQR